MSNRRFFAFLSMSLCLALSSPAMAAPASVRSFDAERARPAEVARETQASLPGTLFRIAGLRGADGETLTLDLEAASLFAADFHLYVDGRDRGRDAVARLKLLRGTVEQWPGSSVALTVDSATGAWGGYLVTGDRFYELALPGGTQDAIARAAVVSPLAPEALAKSGLSDVLNPPAGLDKARSRAQGGRVITPPGAEYEASVAIDSDYEFYAFFANADSATSYLAKVVAGVSELYFRQLGVSLTLSSISLYTSADDPWNAPNPHSGANADVLCEFSSYWQKFRPVKSYPRNAAVFFTGKGATDISGQAWLASLCDYSAKPASCPYGGYGIIVLSKLSPRDIFVTAHELGHVFGSSHTHCYDPPIDTCHSGEDGCYSGPESTPEDGGSVMSYCNRYTLSLGEAGRFGNDSQRVEEVIRGLVDEVGPSCLVRTNDPFALAGESAAPGSATLSWVDPFSNETNWLVEQRLPNGKFKQVKSLPANSTSVTIAKLKHGDNAFRLRAKIKKDFSVYSNVVTVSVP